MLDCLCYADSTFRLRLHFLWSVRGTLWGGYTACDAVSTMHEWGGEHTRRAWALFR